MAFGFELSSEMDFYHHQTTAAERIPSMMRLVLWAALGVMFGLLVWSVAPASQKGLARAHLAPLTTHSLSRALPALGSMKSFTSVDDKVIHAETFEQAEHLIEKQLALEEMERRRQANLYTVDLYTENWDGDVYKGPAFNIMTVLLLLSVLVPVAGLLFAYLTYGTLWGVSEFY